jgi:hypothetical protein
MKHIDIWIIDIRECKSSCDLVVSFREPRIAAGMDPKYVGSKVVVAISITILNYDLRFPVGYITIIIVERLGSH